MNRPAKRHGARQLAMIGLRIGLVLAAAWALRRELATVHVSDVVPQMRALGWWPIALALACTVASFFVLGLIEVLGLRRAAHVSRGEVSARTGMLTAFVANAFGQSIGLSVVTGTAVRMRSYARYGVSAAKSAQVSAFVTITTTLGLLAASAWALFGVVRAGATANVFARPAAVVFALILAMYFAWSVLGERDAIGRGSWQLTRPSAGVSTRQIFLSVIDWLLTGTVLFVVMPASSAIAYADVLRAYMVAQVAGVTSHVPAGAGVFEVVLLALLSRGATSEVHAGVVGALVLFRIVYYAVPLLAAVALASATELLAREEIVPEAPAPEVANVA